VKRVIKWILIAGGIFLVLVLAAPFVISLFWDVQKFKPQIEKAGSELAGRPLTMGDKIDLSVFPWLGVALSDVRLENPPGFKEKNSVTVKLLEVRVKLLPLLSKNIEVKRFVLQEPRIVYEVKKDGRNNWEGIGQPKKKAPPKHPEEKVIPDKSKSPAGLPIQALTVGEFAITKASFVSIDHAKGSRKEISNVNLRLKDVSLDRPVHLTLSAQIDGKPVSLDGKVGPVGDEPFKAKIPLDIHLEVIGEIEANLKGSIANLGELPVFDLSLNVPPFSPRKVLAALGQPFPIKTTDPEALDEVALKVGLKGNPRNVSMADGTFDLDDSKLTFSLQAKEFAKPVLSFDLNLDHIDLDRYLPTPSTESEAKKEQKVKTQKDGATKTDYTPLRSLVVDGMVRVGQFKVQGARIQDLKLKISGKNGRLDLNPVTLRLYEGDALAKGSLDVQQSVPRTSVELDAKGLQVEPLLKDVLEKDILAGATKAKINLQMTGDDAEQIKRSLQGKGDILFQDGAVKGIDLPGMVRNTKAAFGLAEKASERPRTDFSELHAPFTITSGVLNSPGTTLMSPLLRVTASGNADLVKETLDFRVEPKFVATLKGQEDSTEHAGIMVPVLITGSFSSPRYSPDLKGMLKKSLEGGIPKPSELKKLLPGQEGGDGAAESLEEKAKGLMKGLPLGQQ
jgi:AsmA protein